MIRRATTPFTSTTVGTQLPTYLLYIPSTQNRSYPRWIEAGGRDSGRTVGSDRYGSGGQGFCLGPAWLGEGREGRTVLNSVRVGTYLRATSVRFANMIDTNPARISSILLLKRRRRGYGKCLRGSMVAT